MLKTNYKAKLYAAVSQHDFVYSERVEFSGDLF